MKRSFAVLVTFFLSSFAFSQVQSPNLIVNGSFETNSGLSTTVQTKQVTSVSGWTSLDSNSFEVQYKRFGNYFPSQGDVKVQLNSTAHAGMKQTVSVEPGKYYLLSFDYAPGTTNQNGSFVEVTVDGVAIATLSSEDDTWTSNEFKVKAVSSSMVISFEGTASGFLKGGLIDNVRLNKLVNDFYTDNLIQNGSFEDQHNLSENTFDYYTSLGAWKTDLSSTQYPFKVVEKEPHFLHPFDKKQAVVLDAGQNSSILQTVATVSNREYEVTGYYAPRSTSASTNSIQVYVNGVLKGTLSSSLTLWRKFTYTFVAGASPSTIEFRGAGPGDNVGGSLDIISVKKKFSLLYLLEDLFNNPELIVNGSFEETPTIPNPEKFALFTTIPGWTSNTFVPSNFPFEIQYGNNINYQGRVGRSKLELDSTKNTKVFQEVPTLPNRQYLLQFSYAPGKSGDPASNGAEVRWNNTLLFNLSGSETKWTDYSVVVSGIEGNSKLELTGTGTSDGAGAFIDGIILRELGASQPPLADFEITKIGEFPNVQLLINGSSSTDDGGALTYTWRFDGPTLQESADPETTLNISAPGYYQITLIVKDADGNVSYIYKKVYVGEGSEVSDVEVAYDIVRDPSLTNMPPIAVASITADETEAGTELVFDASSSFSISSSVVTYKFIFGDGTEVISASPSVGHAYTTPGSYQPYVIVTDANGKSSTTSFPPVTVLSPTITEARLALSSIQGRAPFTVTLDGSQSIPSDRISEYQFDFGDNSEQYSEAPNVTHTFMSAGTYTVRLQVREAPPFDGVAETSAIITVLPKDDLPIISVNTSILEGKIPLQVMFDASLSRDDHGIAEYNWDFKDGSTVQAGLQLGRIAHTFTTAGTYQVVAKVKDSVGQETQKIITVKALPAPTHLADFVILNASNIFPASITFDATTPESKTEIFEYQWTVNGQTVTKRTPVLNQTFTQAGTYSVTLKTTDQTGATHTKTKSFTLSSAVFGTDFTYSSTTTVANASYQFDGSLSEGLTSIAKFQWNFGEGTSFESASPTVNQIFTVPGAYQVKLTTVRVDGTSSEKTKTIIVSPNVTPAPKLALSALAGLKDIDFTASAVDSLDDEGIVLYTLNFGDGTAPVTSVSAPDLNHSYSADGDYLISLKVQDRQGKEAEFNTIYSTNNPSTVPVADFQPSALDGNPGLVVNFDATASSDDEGIVEYKWVLSNGQTFLKTTPVLSYAFTQIGTFQVSLTVKDADGFTSQKTVSIRINRAPTANFVASVDNSVFPALVTLDASGTTDDASGLSFSWSLDEGSVLLQNSNDPINEIQMSERGTFAVKLTVTDSNGLTSSKVQDIRINSGPVASAVISPQIGDYPLTVTMNALTSSDDTGIASYRWETFEGEVLSTGPVAQRIYTASGFEAVRLIVTDDEGFSTSVVYPIHILSNPAPVSDFVAQADSTTVPATVQLDGGKSRDNRRIDFYRWTIGGQTTQTTVPVFSKVIETAGPLDITLTVVDDQGLASASSKSLSFSENLAPVASLVSSSTEGTIPHAVVFDASGSTDDDGGLIYVWDFGDGQSISSGRAKEAHTYRQPGSYTAMVTVTDKRGSSGVAVKEILVSDPTLTDSSAPEIFSNVVGRSIASSREEIVWALRDDSAVNYKTLRIQVNGETAPSENIIIDETNDLVRLRLTGSLSLVAGTQLKIGFKVTDVPGNFLSKGFYYPVVQQIDPDHEGPVVNFMPKGGDVSGLTPLITIGAYDPAGVNLDSFEVTLNGTPLPTSMISKDYERSRVLIQLDQNYPLIENGLNVLVSTQRDSLGNLSVAGVGLDTRSDKSSVVVVDGHSPIGALGAGSAHTCVTLEGGLKCFGFNFRGQLGIGSTTDTTALDSGFTNIGGVASSISLGSYHSCVLMNDGNVRCWGDGASGQIGTGSTDVIGDDELPTAVPVVSIGASVTQIVSGMNHTCAVKTDNSLSCWGSNFFGELGYGNFNLERVGDDEMPSSVGSVPTGNTSGVIQISAGGNHTCLLNAVGKVKCWGRNYANVLGYQTNGQNIGDNEPASSAPFIDFGEPAIALVSGNNHNCVLLASKKVKCWGANDRGQLGLGHTTDSGTDVSLLGYVELGENVKSIHSNSGAVHTCAITETDELRCWGWGSDGQLGYSDRNNIGDDESPSARQPVELESSVVDVSLGTLHTCAKLDTGKMYCWGDNYNMELGNNEQYLAGMTPATYGPVGFTGGGQSVTVISKIVADKQAGTNPLTVSFNGSQSTVTTGMIVNYKWNFGDGNITETAVPTTSHVYTTSGVFIASLTVVHDSGTESTSKIAISVDQDLTKPIAEFTTNGDAQRIGQSFIFDAQKSFDAFESIVTYDWNFGDGTVISTASSQISHNYGSLGLFLVSLKVTSQDGRISEAFNYPVFVNAINEAPVAQFSCIPGEYSVSCTALTSIDFDGAITNYEWDMGDGEILLGQAVEHVYSKPGFGKFSLSLTVTDNGGLSTTSGLQTFKFDNSAPQVTSSLQSNISIPDSKLNYTLDVSDDNNITVEVTVNGLVVLNSQDKHISSYLNLASGQNIVKVQVTDAAGNTSEEFTYSNINAINTVPQISATGISNTLTKNASFPLSFSIQDDGSTKTSIILNNQIIADEISDQNYSSNLTLQEGKNKVEIVTFDESHQKSSKVFDNIVLDTTPPRLISISPKSGSQYVGNSEVVFNGRASEALSAVSFDSDSAILDTPKTSFTLTKQILQEGNQNYTVTLTDLAGNSTTLNHTYSMILHILYPELITLVSEGGDLKVIGQAGAARFPGQKIEITGGWFNSTEAIAEADGSFEATIRKSTTVDVSSYSSELNFNEGHRLIYQNDTTLSGVIKDIAGVPLPGVKVTIVSTNESALTDQSGVFSITNSTAGDQRVEIDATAVPEEITQGTRKYSKTYLNLSLGHLERNVLEDPIFLTPVLLDGSETIVESNQQTMVTSSNAPGVLIEIPAGAVTFPTGTEVEINGEMKNVINIAHIDAEKTSVPVPDVAVPEKVYALEPSGVRFTEPVKLTLPNDNEFADGTPVIILSKNSDTGQWEIDGAGKAVGGSIETDPGQGITHFSEVYAVPYGLEIKSRDNGELPTIDSQSGALSTSINMPSFKVMGQDVTPSLIYKSNWANPNAIVSNVINLVRDYQVKRVSGSENIFGILGGDGTVTQEVWTSPEEIRSTFFVDDVIGNEVVINATNAPKEAVVSYAMDLDALPSGQYFAKSTYEVKYKFLTITTTKVKSNTFGASKTEKEVKKDVTFQSIMAAPLGQIIHVQNKKNSPYGRGWKLGLTQEILNPGSSRLLVEESNGAASSYILDNSIETLAYDESGIQAAALNSSESIKYVKANGKVAVVNVDEGQDPLEVTPDEQFDIPTFIVDQRFMIGYKTGRSGKKCSGSQIGGECAGHTYYEYNVGCQDNVYRVPAPKKLTSFLEFNATSYYLDQRGAFYKFGSTESLIAGNVGVQPAITTPGSSVFPNIDQVCKNKYDSGCTLANKVFGQTWTRHTTQRSSNFEPRFSYCGPYPTYTAPVVTGNFPNTGYVAGSLTQSKFNDPQDFAPSKTEGDTFYVADTGNNVVRKILSTQNAVVDFAGNRQAQGADQGDGEDALSARIYHPRGVISDSLGNVYISSENGLIWKVDPQGKIVMLAGKTPSSSAKDSSLFSELKLAQPSGLALDETNNILYVADTGNHRVMALDLGKAKANIVAGNYLCNSGPENVMNGNPAISVSLCFPEKIGLDENKNLLVLDKANKMIRRVNLKFTSSGKALYAATTKDGSKVERLDDGSFVRTYRDGTKATFSSSGKHLNTTDRLNNVTSFEYNEDGNLVRAVDPKGGESIVMYNNGKISAFKDPSNRITSFGFSGNELTNVTYPDSTGKAFEYNATNSLMSKEYNQRNFGTTYVYNQWKRLQKVIRSDSTFVSSAETITDTLANTSSSSNPKEAQSYGENNSEGNELVEIYKNASGVETKFNKDLKGYVSVITDAKELKTYIERDTDGKPTKITRPDNSYSTFAYNSLGDLTESYESASDTRNKFNYNTDGNPTLASTEIGGIIKSKTLQYLSNGLVYKETDYNNKSLVRQYYGNGLLFSTTNDLNEILSFQYDSKGNLYRRIAAMGEETVTVRDLAGNILRKTDSKGVTTKYTYDAFNRLTSVETGITAQNAEGDLTSYTYNENGSLTSITDPQNNVTTFEYNSLEQLTKKTTHLGQVTLLTYDPNGNVKTETDPNNHTKTFDYNNADELIRKTLPDNLYEMAYDDFGNLLSVEDNDSKLEYTYEKIHGDYMVTTAKSSGTDLPTVTLGYGYDNFGNRTSMSTPFGGFSYSYDSGNRLTGLTNHLSQSFAFSYDDANRLRLITRPGSTTLLDFDQNSFVTGVTHKRGTQIVNQQTYERDALGNKIKITSSRGVANFTYDQDSQLKTATNTEATASYQSETFNYDSLGNRTNDQLGAYAYDQKKSRLMEDYKFFYAYDNNGNLITKTAKGMSGTVTNFVYSSENQLIEVHQTEGFVQTKSSYYAYDASGRRTKKIMIDHLNGSNSFERHFVFDGNERLADFNHDNEVLAVHTHSTLRTDDTLATQVTTEGRNTGLSQAAGSFFYLKDSLGTISDVVDQNGNMIQHYVYSSFGKILKITDSSEQVTTSPTLRPDYTFTNRELDEETGLYYYRARYYEASIGRFIQEDRDSGSISNPNSLMNKYSYVENNPLNAVDPTGQIKIDWFKLGRGASGAAVGSMFGPVGMMVGFAFAYDPEKFIKKATELIQSEEFQTAAIITGGILLGGAPGIIAAGALLGANTARRDGASAGQVLKAGVVGGLIAGIGFAIMPGSIIGAAATGAALGFAVSAISGGSGKQNTKAAIYGGATGGAGAAVGSGAAGGTSNSGSSSSGGSGNGWLPSVQGPM